MPHGHAHVPEELTEGSSLPTRSERVLELSAVALLSLTVLATAWSGYQASLRAVSALRAGIGNPDQIPAGLDPRRPEPD